MDNCHSPTEPQLELGVTKNLIRPPHPSHPPHLNLEGSSRQPRKLIFGMQPYFDTTRKMTSKKNGRLPQKKWKKNGRRPKKK